MKSQKSSILIAHSRIVSFLLVAMLLFGLSMAQSADFWVTKDYRKWSERECATMLRNSLWAQEYRLYDPIADKVSGRGGIGFVNYCVQLFSALPIPQALVRQLQSANKYETLAPEQQRAFDKRAGEYLTTDYSNTIVVRVDYTNPNPGFQLCSLDIPMAANPLCTIGKSLFSPKPIEQKLCTIVMPEIHF